MNRRNSWILAVSVLLGFGTALAGYLYWSSNVRQPEEGSKPLHTVLYLGWLYSGAYAGEAVAAQHLREKHNLTVELQPGGVGLDPLRRVKDGTFGVASADEVLKVIANNSAPYAIVGVLNNKSPAVFLALKESKIETPKDFVGKRVGILPFGSTRIIYQAMLKAQGVDQKLVQEVVVGPDLRAFLTQATHDVQPAFAYDEPVTLDKLGAKYTVIRPDAFGVHFKGPVYFTTKKTVLENPELVKRFLRSMREGWRRAQAEPEMAIEALAIRAPDLDQARETAVLKLALPYYFDDTKILFDTDERSWQPMITTLVGYQVLNRQLEPADFLSLGILRSIKD